MRESPILRPMCIGPRRNRLVPLHFRAPDDDAKALEQMASETNYKTSELLRMALAQFLKTQREATKNG